MILIFLNRIVKLLSNAVPVSQRVPKSVDPGAEALDEWTRVFVTRRHEEVSLSRVVHLALLDELPQSIVHRLPRVAPDAHRVTEVGVYGVA